MSRTYYVVKEPPRVTYGRFFNAVQRRPALWDPNNRSYGNIRIMYTLWEQVAKETAKRKASSAQLLYLRMRRGYEKYLCGRRDNWNYTREMSFLGNKAILLKKPWPKRKKPRRARGGADKVESLAAADDSLGNSSLGGADSDDSMSDVTTAYESDSEVDEEDDVMFPSRACGSNATSAAQQAPRTIRSRMPSETVKMTENMRRMHSALIAQQRATKIARQMARVELPLVPPQRREMDYDVKEELLSPDATLYSMYMMSDIESEGGGMMSSWPGPSSPPPSTTTTSSAAAAAPPPHPPTRRPVAAAVPAEPIDAAAAVSITPATDVQITPVKKSGSSAVFKVPEAPRKYRKSATEVEDEENRPANLPPFEDWEPPTESHDQKVDPAGVEETAATDAAAAPTDSSLHDAPSTTTAAASPSDATMQQLQPTAAQEPAVIFDVHQGYIDFQNEFYHIKDPEVLTKMLEELEKLPFAVKVSSPVEDAPTSQMASRAASCPSSPAARSPLTRTATRHIATGAAEERAEPQLASSAESSMESAEKDLEPKANVTTDAIFSEDLYVSQFGRVVPGAKRVYAPAPKRKYVRKASLERDEKEVEAKPDSTPTTSNEVVGTTVDTAEKDAEPKASITPVFNPFPETYVSQFGRNVPGIKRTESASTFAVPKRKYVRKASLDARKKEVEAKPDSTPTTSNEAGDTTVDNVEKDAERKSDIPPSPTSSRKKSAVDDVEMEDSAKLDCTPAQTPSMSVEQTPISSVVIDAELKLGSTPALIRRRCTKKAVTDTEEQGAESKLDSTSEPTPAKRKYVRKAVTNTDEKGGESKLDSTPAPTPAKRKYVRKVPLKGAAGEDSSPADDADTPSKRPRGRPPLPATLLKRQAAAAAAKATQPPLDPSIMDLTTCPLTGVHATPKKGPSRTSGRMSIPCNRFTPSKPV